MIREGITGKSFAIQVKKYNNEMETNSKDSYLKIKGGIIYLIEFCRSFSLGVDTNVKMNHIELIKEKTKISGIEQIVEKDSLIFCVNRYQQILMYNLHGEYLGYLQIPFSNHDDKYELYIYQNILCARRRGRGEEQGDIFMFDKCKYCGMIDFKNEGEMVTDYTLKDSENNIITTGITMDSQVLVYANGLIYYDLDEQQVNKQINQKSIVLSENEELKVKGIWKKKLIKIDDNKEIVIEAERWDDFLLQPEIAAFLSFWIMLMNCLIYKISLRQIREKK